MFSDVETWTSAFVWELIGSEQRVGQMVTAGMPFQRQVDLLTSLFRHRFSDVSLQESVETLTRRISELEQQRNTVLHSSWLLESSDPNEATRFKITANRKKGLSHSTEVMTPKDLDSIADGFQQVLAEFTGFMIPLITNLR